MWRMSVIENPEEERDTITKMTIALWNHTDGRETKHFLNNWFDKLLVIDTKYAISLLTGLQIEQGRSWVVEGMICSVIEKYCNTSNFSYLNIVISLIESLPNDISKSIIDAATCVFKNLNRLREETSGDKRILIQHHMNELVANIVSRYNILEVRCSGDSSWQDESIREFLLTTEAAGYDVSQYIDYFQIQKAVSSAEKETQKTSGLFENEQSPFNASTLEKAKEWFEIHEVTAQDISAICGFLKNYQKDKKILFEILKMIIYKVGGWHYSKKRRNIILEILENLELNDDEMAEMCMLMYLYSYEWGSSLIDRSTFGKSIGFSYDVARNTFYSELPAVIISNAGRITKGLLEALSTIESEKNSIIEIWKNAFGIMRLRFPNLNQYSVDFRLEEVEELSGIRNCLLLRFIDGGKEQFLASYAYLANAAEEKNYSEFTESVVFCLDYYKKFNLVTQIAIADLVRCYGCYLNRVDRKRIVNAINAVYPTGNLLLDVIFSEFTIYKDFFLTCTDKNVPDYMEQEGMQFYLSEQLYDLGKEKTREKVDVYAKNSIYRDPIMQIVKSCGINYMELYKKLHASANLNKKMQDYVGGSGKIPETNTVYKSYVIQYALHAIIGKAFKNRTPELILMNIFNLIPDYQGMYRLFKCRDIQPRNHLYDKSDSCESFLKNNKDAYILIGRSETRKQIDYRQASFVWAYQGIVGENDEKHQFPFRQCLTQVVGRGAICMDSGNAGSLMDFIRTIDMELEDENYLWPGMPVSKLFNVHIKFDYWNRRYIAVNQKNDIIFVMKKWSSSYKGDSDYSGNAIPLYSGTVLSIKREYIEMLERQFGTLMMKTCVKSLTQNY